MAFTIRLKRCWPYWKAMAGPRRWPFSPRTFFATLPTEEVPCLVSMMCGPKAKPCCLLGSRRSFSMVPLPWKCPKNQPREGTKLPRTSNWWKIHRAIWHQWVAKSVSWLHFVFHFPEIAFVFDVAWKYTIWIQCRLPFFVQQSHCGILEGNGGRSARPWWPPSWSPQGRCQLAMHWPRLAMGGDFQCGGRSHSTIGNMAPIWAWTAPIPLGSHQQNWSLLPL